MIKIVIDLNLPFYLTGGTVLSRHFFHHRYSDDLDYFVNDDPHFFDYFQKINNYLLNVKDDSQLRISSERTLVTNNLIRTFFIKDDVELKVDFVNDIPIRFGEILFDNILGRIDNLRNILSNKISALYRLETKDFVDVWCICKNYKFIWRELIAEAKQKEISIDPIEISNLFRTIPFQNLRNIKWIKPFDLNKIISEMLTISDDILEGTENKLFK